MTNELRYLESCKGVGTSMVTLIMKAGSQPCDITRKMVAETSAARNIRSRANRNSVLSALRSIGSYAKSQGKLPSHGVAIFAGADVGRQYL